MIFAAAGALTIAAAGVHAGAGAGDFFSKDSANRAGDEPMGASSLEGMALAGGGFESFPRGFASEASEEFVLVHFVSTSYVQGNSKPVLTACQAILYLAQKIFC